MDGCKNYTVLSEANRAQGNVVYNYVCDRDLLTPGWYRFQGAAGDRMADKCVLMERCGASESGWLSGGHPTVDEGVVVRRVCFHMFDRCCNWLLNIKVKNCSSYYVYELQKPRYCTFRYCGNAGAGKSHLVGVFVCLSEQPIIIIIIIIILGTHFISPNALRLTRKHQSFYALRFY